MKPDGVKIDAKTLMEAQELTCCIDMLKVENINTLSIDLESAIKQLVKKAVVYRNGKYTTVKWGDGTIARVQCKESDYPNDELGFEAALAKRIFGSRTKFKKFLNENIVDIEDCKNKKAAKKTLNKSKDRYGKVLKVGDTVTVSHYAPNETLKKYFGKIFVIFKFSDHGKLAHVRSDDCVITIPCYDIFRKKEEKGK